MSRRLDRGSAILVIVDVQQRLMPVIDQAEHVIANIDRLIRGTHILAVPRIVTEQYVKGLGATVEPLRASIDETGGGAAIEKSCFSAAGCSAFASLLENSRRRQVILCGVEAHVCVYQTALDLLDAGVEVHLVADAVSSRSARNRELAVERLRSEGAKITSTEMVLFELTVESGSDEFRVISRLVK